MQNEVKPIFNPFPILSDQKHPFRFVFHLRRKDVGGTEVKKVSKKKKKILSSQM
jgi:hypothetical protein